MKKIAVIETSYIGDLAFLLPFFKAIKRIFPDSQTTLITTPAPAQLAWIFPSLIDEIIIFNKREKKISSFYEVKRTLEKKNFDILFAPHRFPSTKLLTKFIQAEEKISYKTPFCKSFFNKCVPYRKDLAVEERSGALLNAIGEKLEEKDFREILPSLEMIVSVKEKYRDLFTSPFIFLVPGSEWATKRWPAGYYAILAQWICENGYRVYAGGSSSERNLLEELTEKSKGCIKILNVTLKEMLLIMYHAEIIIGNDTGPVHVMRIMNKKVITIFGPTPHNIFRWKDHQVPVFANGVKCRPCSSHGPRHCPRGDLSCQFSVIPEMVWEKFLWMKRKSC